jgi:hypothetical protein
MNLRPVERDTNGLSPAKHDAANAGAFMYVSVVKRLRGIRMAA